MTFLPTPRAGLVVDRRRPATATPRTPARSSRRSGVLERVLSSPSARDLDRFSVRLHLCAVRDDRVDDEEVDREQRERPDEEALGPREVHERADRNEDDANRAGPHPSREEAEPSGDLGLFHGLPENRCAATLHRRRSSHEDSFNEGIMYLGAALLEGPQ